MSSKLKIEILGNNPSYFLKELIKNKINFYALEKYPKRLVLLIDNYNYERILSFKTSYKINIIER